MKFAQRAAQNSVNSSQSFGLLAPLFFPSLIC